MSETNSNSNEAISKKSAPKKKPQKKKPQTTGSSSQAAAKQPPVTTGYHMFLRERIPRLKVDNPELGHKEYLPAVSAIWRTLTDVEKAVYNDQAKLINERKAAQKDLVEAKDGSKEKHIPIFTEAFMNHNREREKEFRRLQKEATEMQQQSALLSAHSDSLRTAINRLENEAASQRERSQKSSKRLESSRRALIASLVDINSNVADHAASAEQFQAFSTAELLSNLRTTLSATVPDLDEEQKAYIKSSLLGVLQSLAAEY